MSEVNIVRDNALKDPNYAPYCLRSGCWRMAKVGYMQWECQRCGNKCDERLEHEKRTGWIKAEEAKVKKCVNEPCPECPFNRKVKPGTLGGSPVQVYAGQINGPFVLACHMHVNFDDPNWRAELNYTNTPQCAGAAIFRANLGVSHRMPAALPRLPANHEQVFSTMSEFVEHHQPDMPSRYSRAFDDPRFIEMCVAVEMEKIKS